MSCVSLLALDSGIPFYAHHGQSFALFLVLFFILFASLYALPVLHRLALGTCFFFFLSFSESTWGRWQKKLSKDSPVLEVYPFLSISPYLIELYFEL